MLSVSGIHTYYGAVHALKGVDIEVGEGEIVALIGANGAGKSTLMKILDGIYTPDIGQIAFQGQRVTIDNTHAALKLGIHLAWRAGRISEYDALIGRKLATVMAGGTLPHPSTVTEQELLDLEREAFLSLVGERKTLERIQHMLKTGKPLRN